MKPAIIVLLVVVSGPAYAPAEMPQTMPQTVRSVRELPARGRTMVVIVTAYSAPCKIQGTGMRTATGKRVRDKKGRHIPGCAVDPRIIGLGSKVRIPGIGTLIADDTGGKIKGSRIDIRLSSRNQCLRFGRKQLKVEIIEKRREIH